MKVVIAFVLVGVVTTQFNDASIGFNIENFTPQQKKRMLEIAVDCVKESQVDQETLKNAEVYGLFPNNPYLKKYCLCFSKKIHLQKENGQLQTALFKRKFMNEIQDPGKVESLCGLCLVQKETPEDTALDSFHCFYYNTPTFVNLFFLV